MPGVVVASIAIALSASGDEPTPPATSSVVMEKKSELSQDMLNALMHNDLDRLERDVKLMQVFTRLEAMYRSKTPDYQEQLKKFQAALSTMSKAVSEKNEKGASEAYVDMLQTCIRCHRIIRNP
ncbi:MAG: cytochrome c [Planctomycetes bacterium]|nr:cytochrome c [Planctomycetota bacterium]